MMDPLVALYQAHLKTLQDRTGEILNRCGLDAVLIHSGELSTVFFDDHHYPFKVNPHFKAWLPVVTVPNCWLWVDGVNKPKLWFYAPIDYWHRVEPLPCSFWSDEIEIIALSEANEISRLLPSQRDHVAYLGPVTARAAELGFIADNINPPQMLDYLHYHRAFKTDYELHCMREAQKIAVHGHHAAKQAFFSGMSEFDINSVYLSATRQRDDNVPYSNIIALNEHAAILHYTQLDQQAPASIRSFLIDAGAEYQGYAADLTRSYAQAADSDYAALIRDLNSQMLGLITTMKAGVAYGDLHRQMHQRLAKLLIQHRFIEGISEEAMVEQDLTGPFMPHGLGHLLGLQVHDVAGFMQNDHGDCMSPPAHYPWLRCTRTLSPGMVVTIEPGIYFIDSLLAPWREGQFSRYFNWSRIEAMKPYGGIRIEDNIIIHPEGVENMTRDLDLS